MSNEQRKPFGGEHDFESTNGTVYQLMHHGYRKGEEQFRNRIWLSVNVDRESGLSREQVAADVARAANSHEKLVAALREIESHLDGRMTHQADNANYPFWNQLWDIASIALTEAGAA